MDERLRNSGIVAPSADRVPTLTEVLDLDQALDGAADTAAHEAQALDTVGEPSWQLPEHVSLVEPAVPVPVAVDAGLPSSPATPSPSTPSPTSTPTPSPVDEDTLVARVVDALLPSLDAMLQERLLEALAPALERAAEQLLHDSRAQLAATLHQCVQETVAQVLQSTRVDP